MTRTQDSELKVIKAKYSQDMTYGEDAKHNPGRRYMHFWGARFQSRNNSTAAPE